jgi:hypothetical protein
MSFFKIEKTGCVVRSGLLQVRYDLFWDETDAEYSLVEVPVFPDEGYTGEDTEEAYQAWFKSLPTQLTNLAFCTRFAYFEPSVTDEEIAFVGALKLELTVRNYPDMKAGNNVPFNWQPEFENQSAQRLAQVKEVDFTTVNNAELYRVK